MSDPITARMGGAALFGDQGQRLAPEAGPRGAGRGMAPRGQFAEFLARPSAAAVEPARAIAPSPTAAEPAPMLAGGADALRRAAHSLERGRKAIDRAIARSRRGQVFSQEELISMQAEVYRYSQELELAGRLVDKAVGAIRQTLQSQT